MTWAGDVKGKLTWMVNDITEKLLGLDILPKPESLWWEAEGNVGNGDLLGYRFRRTEEGNLGTEQVLRKGMGRWWRDGQGTSIERRASL